jgi:hypothetical protein
MLQKKHGHLSAHPVASPLALDRTILEDRKTDTPENQALYGLVRDG